MDAAGRDFLPFLALDQSVRDNVETLCKSEFISEGSTISCATYDVKSGSSGSCLKLGFDKARTAGSDARFARPSFYARNRPDVACAVFRVTTSWSNLTGGGLVTTTTLVIIIIVAAVILLAPIAILLFSRRSRSRRREEQRERTAQERGSEEDAEKELRRRRGRVERQVVPLSSESRQRYEEHMREVEQVFVDNPDCAVEMADRTVSDLLVERNFVTDAARDDRETEQGLAVMYPEIAGGYREARRARADVVARSVRDSDSGEGPDEETTEDLRQVVHKYHSVYERLAQD